MIIGFVRIRRVGSMWSVARVLPPELPNQYAHDIILCRSIWRALSHALWILRHSPRIPRTYR